MDERPVIAHKAKMTYPNLSADHIDWRYFWESLAAVAWMEREFGAIMAKCDRVEKIHAGSAGLYHSFRCSDETLPGPENAAVRTPASHVMEFIHLLQEGCIGFTKGRLAFRLGYGEKTKTAVYIIDYGESSPFRDRTEISRALRDLAPSPKARQALRDLGIQWDI